MRFADEQELSFSMERFQGIDRGLEGNDTPMHMSPDAENCDTAGGVLKLATGWAVDTAIAAAPGPIRSLMNFYKNNANGTLSTLLLAATDSGLWRWDGSAWQDIAGSQPVTSGLFTHVNYQKKDTAMIVLANGTDSVYCWSGSGKVTKLAANGAWVQAQPSFDESANTIRLTQHGLKDGDCVVFDKHKGTMPSGVNVKDTYYVRDAKPDTFKVSTTKNGSAVNLKGKGTTGWRVARAKWIGSGNPTANASTDEITIMGHGLLDDDELIFDHYEGKLPGGIADNTVYYALVTSPDTFKISTKANNPEDMKVLSTAGTLGWRVRKADLTSWLAGGPTASAKADVFSLTNHGLKEVDANSRPTAVEFAVDPALVLPGGINAGATYYVKRVNSDAFKLKTSASAATTVDITSPGVGGWLMRRSDEQEWRNDVPNIDLSTDTLSLAGHGYAENDAVVFGVPDDNSYVPDGLYARQTYYVRLVDSNRFRLLASKDASAPVDITSAGMAGWALKKASETTWLAAPTVDVANNWITISGHGLTEGEAVTVGLDESRLLPGGLLTGRTYYVRDVEAGTYNFRLAATPTSGALPLSGAGRTGWRIKPVGGVWKQYAPSYNTTTEKITLRQHGFKNGDAVTLDVPSADGFMPGGITAHDGTPNGKFYYLVKVTASTFQVADKPGGTPIKLTTAGMPGFRMRLSNENRPMGGSVALHAERIWCAGEKTRPNSAFFSDDMNPNNWAIGADSAGEIVKPSWDGDAVTAVANLFDGVVVFKARSMFRVAGTTPADYQVAPVYTTAGTLSPRSICQWQNGAFFLSPLGIMAFDGSRCELLGGGALSHIWARLNPNPDALAGACAAISGDRLLMAVPLDGSLENNAVVEFEIGRAVYMLRTGVQVSAWLPGDPMRFASGNRVCLWGRDGAGQAITANGGQPIQMRWVTPETDFGDRGAMKTVTGVLVTGKGGALVVKVKSGEQEVSKTVTLPREGGTVKASVRLKGRMLSLEFANVEGSAVELTGVTVLYEREEV